MDAENASRIKAWLQQDIDWGYLIRTASLHGMIPLLYRNLKAVCPEAIPRPVLAELQNCFFDNARRNLFLTGELLRLLSLFKAEGIDAIPFKGPLLAAWIYHNLALRPFGDLDLLVHKQDVLKCRELLIFQGYRLWIQMTDAQEMAHLQSEHAYRLVGDDNGVIVELHWDLIPRYFAFPLDVEQLWGRLESIPFAGTIVKSFKAEDLLLILCMHGAKHHWSRLGWICDIAELIRVPQALNWKQMMEQARQLNGMRRLFLGLFLARDLLGATLPEEVSHRLEKTPALPSLAAEVRGQLFHQGHGAPGIIAESRFQFKVMERLQDKVQYIGHCLLAPNDRDWAFLPLPASFSFLYFLLRPIRLVGEQGPHLFKRLMGNRSREHHQE